MSIYDDWNMFLEASKEDCFEKFGKLLWDDALGYGEEPDTPTETKYFDLLVRFLQGDVVANKSGDGLKGKIIQSFKKIKECQSEFDNKSVLIPEGIQYAYRGSNLISVRTKGTVRELLQGVVDIFPLDRLEEIKSNRNNFFRTDGGIGPLIKIEQIKQYRPKSGIQSWTTEPQIAMDFERR